MADILDFASRKKNNDTNSKIDRLTAFTTEQILSNDPSSNILEFSTNNIRVTTMLIDRSYEEERLKFFSERKVMAASGLVSLMILTPCATRDELYEIAMIDSLLWHSVPMVERFITAHEGGYEYNFRSAHHDIVQVAFQILSYTN